jgi:hypothetical protein
MDEGLPGQRAGKPEGIPASLLESADSSPRQTPETKYFCARQLSYSKSQKLKKLQDINPFSEECSFCLRCTARWGVLVNPLRGWRPVGLPKDAQASWFSCPGRAVRLKRLAEHPNDVSVHVRNPRDSRSAPSREPRNRHTQELRPAVTRSQTLSTSLPPTAATTAMETLRNMFAKPDPQAQVRPVPKQSNTTLPSQNHHQPD